MLLVTVNSENQGSGAIPHFLHFTCCKLTDLDFAILSSLISKTAFFFLCAWNESFLWCFYRGHAAFLI